MELSLAGYNLAPPQLLRLIRRCGFGCKQLLLHLVSTIAFLQEHADGKIARYYCLPLVYLYCVPSTGRHDVLYITVKCYCTERALCIVSVASYFFKERHILRVYAATSEKIFFFVEGT